MKLYRLRFFIASAIMFSVASIIMVSFASAQYGGTPDIPQMQEVSGNYVNDDVGVRITFPSGWSGIAMETPQGTMATVSPGGMSSGEPTQIMTLMMAEKAKVDSPPSDPTQGKSKCDTESTKATTVSGAQATETVMKCTDDNGKVTKAKIISSQTETHWISAMFMAPESEYSGSVGKFDDSIKTLNILNVMETESPPDTTPDTTPETTEEPVKLETRDMPVSVDGKNVDVQLQSSSSITKFGLDEDNKKISFTASGDNDGKTLVSVGSVLKGPYAVTIDGQLAKDYLMADENTMQLTYLSGTHEISISGAQVVPEFPLALMGVIAVVLGMVVILGRTKIFGTIKY